MTNEKRFYIRDAVEGQPRQIWEFEGRTACVLGISNPQSGLGVYYSAEVGEDIWDCIRRQTPWFDDDRADGKFHAMALDPGEYHPRIARPMALDPLSALFSPSIEADRVYAASARSQVVLLLQRLLIICRSVQPTGNNLEAFGHEMRNLLLLAATEVEMHWKGIFTANDHVVKNFATPQYVRLAEPLKLSEFSVTFHDFPDLAPNRPFLDWNALKPTQSLPWYDAYNAVKHDREREFKRASLRYTFDAVSACLILLVAQFGTGVITPELSGSVAVGSPSWEIGDMYFSLPGAEWKPVSHQISRK